MMDAVSQPSIAFIDLQSKTTTCLLTENPEDPNSWYSFSAFSRCTGWQEAGRDTRHGFTLLDGAQLSSFEVRWSPTLAQCVEDKSGDQGVAPWCVHRFCIRGQCRFE